MNDRCVFGGNQAFFISNYWKFQEVFKGYLISNLAYWVVMMILSKILNVLIWTMKLQMGFPRGMRAMTLKYLIV